MSTMLPQPSWMPVVGALVMAVQPILTLAQPSICDEERVSQWKHLRDMLSQNMQGISGRVPWVYFKYELQFFDEVLLSELRKLGADRGPEARGTECAIGQLLVSLANLLLEVQYDSEAMTRETMAELLGHPWRTIFSERWPIFTILGTLVRWSRLPIARLGNPYYFGTAKFFMAPVDPTVGLNKRDGSESVCDAAESNTLRIVRHLVSEEWHAHGTFSESNVASTSTDLDNEIINALLHLTSRRECWWTYHPGQYLGVSIDGLGWFNKLEDAKDACSINVDCVGVTLHPGGGISLRRGTPFLLKSNISENSYVRWCPTVWPGVHSEIPSPCPFASISALLLRALSLLDNTRDVEKALLIVSKVQNMMLSEVALVGKDLLLSDAWRTEWPVWELLSRLQHRLTLVQSSSHATGSALQPPWAKALQQALKFDDEAWHLATSELHRLSQAADINSVIPETLQENNQCRNGEGCAGELFARLHLLLYKSKRLPVRDPILFAPEDSMAYLHLWHSSPARAGWHDDPEKWFAEGAMSKPSGTREEQLVQLTPQEHPLQIDRRQLAHFVLEARSLIGEESNLGRCLEWDHPFIINHGFGGMCEVADVFTYSEPDPNNPYMGLSGNKVYASGSRHYWGDLNRVEGVGIKPETFGLIVCPFVFEHVAQPFVAMGHVVEALRPGGYILWSAPMFQHYHGAPADFYRYTPKGARALAEHAGLEVVRLFAPGDLSLTSGAMMGMHRPYWSDDDILKEAEPYYHLGEDAPRNPLNVFMLLRKP